MDTRGSETETRLASGRCSRCQALADADVSMPWKKLDGKWYEWVKVRPHLHVRTFNSTCRPKGYARLTHRQARG